MGGDMTRSGAARSINALLVFLIGLLSGVILGYMVGHTAGNGPPTVTQTNVRLNDVLSVDNAWIVEGFTCPMPGCTNPLLLCQGELSRRIREWVNAQVRAGRPGREIRQEIIQKHGDNLFKTGSEAATDSSQSQ
jgi:hypothetical protein